jgi:hypothetical protein
VATDSKKIKRTMGSSSLQEYPACITPTHRLADAAKNHMMTNAVVATVIDVALALAMSFPMLRQAAQTTTPPRTHIKVRMMILLIGSTAKTAVLLER